MAQRFPFHRFLPQAAGITAGLAACLLLVQSGPAQPPRAAPGPPGGRILDLAPRQQWNANFGYCGEIAFIVAGLSFGQYLSQYEARAVASASASQSAEGSQLLLGVNDGAFAARSHLELSRWSGGTGAEFLAWIRGHVLQNHPVIIGLYANQRRFYGRRDPQAGSPEYDHIVSVLGVLPGSKPALPLALAAPIGSCCSATTASSMGTWRATTATAFRCPSAALPEPAPRPTRSRPPFIRCPRARLPMVSPCWA